MDKQCVQMEGVKAWHLSPSLTHLGEEDDERKPLLKGWGTAKGGGGNRAGHVNRIR